MPGVDPSETLGVGKQQARFATQHGNGPGIESAQIENGIENDGTVRRKLRTHLRKGVVGQLHKPAIRKKLGVDLPGADEGVRAADEGEDASIRRKRRGNSRIGEICELDQAIL